MSIGIKFFYYGNIVIVVVLGRYEKVEVVSILLIWYCEVVYVIYYGGILLRVVVVNMRGYNIMVDGEGLVLFFNLLKRGSVEYFF